MSTMGEVMQLRVVTPTGGSTSTAGRSSCWTARSGPLSKPICAQRRGGLSRPQPLRIT